MLEGAKFVRPVGMSCVVLEFSRLNCPRHSFESDADRENLVTYGQTQTKASVYRMAQKTLVVLEDDLDGGTADETVRFSLDGVNYEIDLSSKNASKFRDDVAKYVGSGRRVGGRAVRGRAGGTGRGAGNNRSAQIREWARGAGLKVSDRGRIPSEIVAHYDAAH